jgi:hypothetical protein
LTPSLFAVIVVVIVGQRKSSGKTIRRREVEKVGRQMEKAAKENITEEIIVSPEELVDGVKEEAIEAPLRLREKLRQLATVWGCASVRSSASRSEAVYYGLAGMYGAECQALAEEHERARSDKG